MKMGKKVREYKAGDFIFAKVKGYPAWPARVQRMNGKKYFVYFYGTGETANLPPNMIFDYAENKDKFLNKAVKRRDFNDGVKQIEYDFANNVPLEQVIGVPLEVEEGANDTVNESAANDTVDESMADTTAVDETMAEENTTQNDTGIEDSDETGALVIDEGKQGKTGKKPTPKTPAKETPKAKEPKTPRGRAKKDEEAKEELKEDDNKKDEELVSRSGRKIRPKRYIDEHTEENTTLPSSAPKKRRAASPVEKDKENKEKDGKEKNIKQFNAVTRSELEDLKEPFTTEDPEKENIIIAYLPAGQYIGIKLFQSRPTTFKNDSARLQWDKQAARNALTLKSQLEKGHITPQSVLAQLVMDLNLTDEEKATLDKDRETEEKKSRVHFLKVEMKLIELDAKIKTCLCLEKADTELCLKLLDELMALDIKPLMLLKHPTTPETIKRMRAYVGNTPSWELTENAALLFSQHAHKIRKQADIVYANLRKLFNTPEGLSFWEFFTERVEQFKKATEKYTSDEILEMVHEPLEMSFATSHTMRAAIDAANEQEKEEADEAKKAKPTPAKTKKVINNGTPKTPAKRQSSRNKPEEKDKEKPNTEETSQAKTEQSHVEQKNETESKEIATEEKEVAKDKREKKSNKDSKSNKEDNTIKDKDSKTNKEDSKNKEKDSKANNEGHIIKDKDSKANKDDNKSKSKDSDDKELRDTNDENDSEVKEKTPEKADESTDDSKQESSVEVEKSDNLKEISKETDKDSKSSDKKSDREDKRAEKEKTEDEPRAKRSRESKKTDPPPRSPTKRKSKF
ncbi:PC4 and SFRS1-interacting protein-like [Pararge aegeria]|nr:PC4 and SFRS1-interacting protein-like [Pararge aegeria]